MMKRRAFGLLLSLCLALMLIPAAASANKTLTVPCTIDVVTGDSAEPGQTWFYLELMKNTGEVRKRNGDVGFSCPAVKTNGVGGYPGDVTITGTSEALS